MVCSLQGAVRGAGGELAQRRCGRRPPRLGSGLHRQIKAGYCGTLRGCLVYHAAPACWEDRIQGEKNSVTRGRHVCTYTGARKAPRLFDARAPKLFVGRCLPVYLYVCSVRPRLRTEHAICPQYILVCSLGGFHYNLFLSQWAYLKSRTISSQSSLVLIFLCSCMTSARAHQQMYLSKYSSINMRCRFMFAPATKPDGRAYIGQSSRRRRRV